MALSEQFPIKRTYARRLRDVYRSAGWPSLDLIEMELLASGLLERIDSLDGLECVRVTDAGMDYVALVSKNNRAVMSKHNQLSEIVVKEMVRAGRIVWTELPLRAWVEAESDDLPGGRWKMCRPDVFSIRNSTIQAYLEPVIHEVKVSRADLLGDLKNTDKRKAYLDLGGQCWYVLGTNAKGEAIAEPEEIPDECGVMMFREGRLEIARNAPKRPIERLPHSVWMALAKSTPMPSSEIEESNQSLTL